MGRYSYLRLKMCMKNRHNKSLPAYFLSLVAESHSRSLIFSLALQNRNVGHGGVSPHFGPPAQQQIRERSHQDRELFVLFIKNLRLFFLN